MGRRPRFAQLDLMKPHGPRSSQPVDRFETEGFVLLPSVLTTPETSMRGPGI
jgi:hypothetical protein